MDVADAPRRKGFGIRLEMVIDDTPYATWLTSTTPVSWGSEADAVAFPTRAKAKAFGGDVSIKGHWTVVPLAV